ncbi:toll/interleukin-1 receptor domain-containing protein [Methylibium rhizosphaerae]|uniref:toll/interleukin-1 receptor domain-containing protein n=1 Tax=Methylibium rhizosphaerae TaxID=2570323 RepID=UPI001127B6B2|nr:toll/interleukin-1 receptor domain-containing protein [Methylibium rhizosphaerae]
MKIFISWSDERSHQLAQALHHWLPLVLPYVQPWLSQADISAGDRWAQEVAKELESSNFGIICVTPENIGSPWILFEAGALAKSLQGAKVIPLLLGLEFSDVSGPLAQFQAKKLGKAGLSEIVQSINQSAQTPEPEDRVKDRFAGLWPDIEKKIEAIPAQAPGAKRTRPQHEILEELVATVRGVEGRFARLDEGLVDADFRSRRRRRPMHPMMLDDMSRMISEEGDDPIALLMFGSMVRDDLPWLYELVVEVYREVRSGDAKAAQRALDRLRRMTKMLHRGPFMEEFAGSKESHMMIMELPRMLDHLLHRIESRRPRIGTNTEAEAAKTDEDR